MWQGDMHGRGVHGGGKDVWQGVCVAGEACMAGGVCGRRDGHCSRQYASYWNAFLLHYVLYTLHSDRDRDREPLFSIVPIPVPVPVPFPVPCSVYEPLHSFFFATCFRLAPSCQVIHNSTKLYKGRELTVNAVLNTGFSTHEGSGWQANFG